MSSLATKAALTAIENNIPDVSSLVKKTNYNTKITEIENKLNNPNHDKYITTPEVNALATDVFNARLAQVNLITKTILMLNCRLFTEKLRKIKHKIYLLKIT